MAKRKSKATTKRRRRGFGRAKSSRAAETIGQALIGGGIGVAASVLGASFLQGGKGVKEAGLMPMLAPGAVMAAAALGGIKHSPVGAGAAIAASIPVAAAIGIRLLRPVDAAGQPTAASRLQQVALRPFQTMQLAGDYLDAQMLPGFSDAALAARLNGPDDQLAGNYLQDSRNAQVFSAQMPDDLAGNPDDPTR